MKLEGKTCLILYNQWGSVQSAVTTDEEEFDSTAESRSETQTIKKILKEFGMNVRVLGIRGITARIIRQIEEIKPDMVFNLCEALYEKSQSEMYIAGLLELLRIPYTGSPPFALGLALNKLKCKQVLKSVGIPVPPSVVVPVGEQPNIEDLTSPFIVKPIREDGSAGITKDSVAETQADVEKLVRMVHEEYSQPALVEEFIEGKEFTVAVVGNPPRVLGIGEIDFSKTPEGEPKIISYRAKWDATIPVYAVFPANLTNGLKARVEKTAVKAFQAIGCRDYVRIDIRVSENRRVYVLEINTNPDISPEAGFEDAAKAAGITYTDFVHEVVENTLKRKGDKNGDADNFSV